MSLAALSDLSGLEDGCATIAPDSLALAEFPTPLYSRKQVVKAGKALLEPMPWIEDRADEYRQVFKIAYDWRSSHAYPMRKMRQELRAMVQDLLKRRGITAARLKRMKSIRKKLERLDTTLAQIQDIGGCRAIVDSQDTLNLLLAQFRSDTARHKLRIHRSYIDDPRLSGYRSHHLVFDFQPENASEEPYRDRRIEIQLRSRLQHSWATAVEAIGLHRNEDLKASEGDADWLRFFLLVSAEFAEFEGTAPVPYAPLQPERIKEIKALNKSLGAVRRLETLNEAFRYLEHNKGLRASYYMLQFDNAKQTLDISSYDRIAGASEGYGYAESNHMDMNTVVVEVDTLEALKEAYPNYFLDVRLFTQNVVHMMSDKPLVTKLQIQQEKQTALGHDVSWLRKYFPGMYQDNG